MPSIEKDDWTNRYTVNAGYYGAIASMDAVAYSIEQVPTKHDAAELVAIHDRIKEAVKKLPALPADADWLFPGFSKRPRYRLRATKDGRRWTFSSYDFNGALPPFHVDVQ